MNQAQEALCLCLKSRLSEKRFCHSVKVAEEANYLAELLFLSPETTTGLVTAALLHDITKEESVKRQLSRLQEAGYPLTEEDLRSRETLHARSGYVCAKSEFLLPETYAHAILYHSTGGKHPSPEDKILFTADYTEESRRHEACQSLRRQLHEALEKTEQPKERLAILDKAVYTICNRTLELLVKEDRFIHPDTLWMRNSLCSQ